MKLYRDYKMKQEQQRQEVSDRESMGVDDNVVIIYEHENSFFEKVRSIFWMLILFMVVGMIVVFLAKYIYFW